MEVYDKSMQVVETGLSEQDSDAIGPVSFTVNADIIEQQN